MFIRMTQKVTLAIYNRRKSVTIVDLMFNEIWN